MARVTLPDRAAARSAHPWASPQVVTLLAALMAEGYAITADGRGSFQALRPPQAPEAEALRRRVGFERVVAVRRIVLGSSAALWVLYEGWPWRRSTVAAAVHSSRR